MFATLGPDHFRRWIRRGWLAAMTAGLMIAGAGHAAEPPTIGTYVAQGYREIAFFALNQLASPAIAAHFAARAESTEVSGAAIEPEAIGDWAVDPKVAVEAGSARRQLLSRLDNGVESTSPLTSAVAVLNFSCWVAFASADLSSSAECRRRFFAALAALPAHPSPAQATTPAGATTILIALQACAVPPWLGDCPVATEAPARPTPEAPVQRHAGGETGSGRALSALGDSAEGLTPISALAGGAPGSLYPARAVTPPSATWIDPVTKLARSEAR